MSSESVPSIALVKSGVPEPPTPLSPRGLEHWERLYELLDEAGRIDRLDHYLLARYCDRLKEWEELNEFMQKSEPFMEMVSNKGHKYFAKHPKVSRIEQVEPLLLRMEKQLGLARHSRGSDTEIKKDMGARRAKLYSRS